MVTMLTLFGSDFQSLGYNALNREYRVQKHLLSVLKGNKTSLQKILDRRLAKEEAGIKGVRKQQTIEDEILFLEIFIEHLESLLREIEWHRDRRVEPESNFTDKRPLKAIRARNLKMQRARNRAVKSLTYWKETSVRDGMAISWDREKFLLIARDRGYQTEEALIFDVAEELRMERSKAASALKSGRFTWGQVLYLGAMMQMTPKEFCDTFLSGYFIEHNDDEYRADYRHIEQMAWMKEEAERMPKMPPPVEVEVGADGRPLDEEEWFD